MPRDEQGRFTDPGRGPASGRPASGRPPEREGNTVAVKAGVRSARFVDPLAQELAEALLEVRPDLVPYPWAVAAWARAEARCLLIADYQHRKGLVNEDKGGVQLGADAAKFERLAMQARNSLGLDARSEAELTRARREALDPGEVLRGILEHGRQVMADRAIEAGS
jgi:hypothetical protein